jgi:outer membrane protein assembly factor BamD (BamD/ComL family)
VLDIDGKERSRLEGYFPKEEFFAHLKMGLARLALTRKDWTNAAERYDDIANAHSDSIYAPQAIYYRGVSRYSSSHDHNDLGNTATELKENYDGNEWQIRSIPWL